MRARVPLLPKEMKVNLDSRLKKIKKFLGIEGEVVSCVSEIVLLFLTSGMPETQQRHVIEDVSLTPVQFEQERINLVSIS